MQLNFIYTFNYFLPLIPLKQVFKIQNLMAIEYSNLVTLNEYTYCKIIFHLILNQNYKGDLNLNDLNNF